MAIASTFYEWDFAAILAVVVHALCDKDGIRKAEIGSKRNHGRNKACPYSSEEVCQVTDKPDE